jgi:FkbM family methyltransferase
MTFPVQRTKFNIDPELEFQWEWFDRDYFISKDGTKEFPEHHCKVTWTASQPHIQRFRNAVDIGCRDGEYTRYLHKYFNHTYCFDYRARKLFPRNVDLTKVTHFRCGLGEEHKVIKVSGGGSMTSERRRKKEDWIDEEIFTLDQFNLPDIDYIKIDVDGFELRVLQGSIKTIKRFSPLVVLEAENNDITAINFMEKELNYSVVAWDSHKRNVVMKENK